LLLNLDRQLAHGPLPEDHAERPGVNLRHYWFVLARRRWLIAAIIGAVTVAAVIITLLTPSTYAATATIEVARTTPDVTRVEGQHDDAPPTFDPEFYQTQYGLLKSPALAEEVVLKLGLADDPAFLPSDPRISGTSDADRMRRERRAVAALVDRLVVKPVSQSSLIDISFESHDATLAARVVNGTADAFIDTSLRRKLDASSYARQYLEGRLASLVDKLTNLQGQLVAKAASERIVQVADKSGTAQSLQSETLGDINSALTQAIAMRITAEQRWNRIRSIPLTAIPEVQQNQVVQALQQQRSQLLSDYAQQRQSLKPRYPAMQEKEALIADLAAPRARPQADIRTTILTQYQVALAQENALRRQVDRSTDDVISLQQRGLSYDIIQRDFDTTRSLYDGLLQRYKEIGVASGASLSNISIVSRAHIPERPFKPKPVANIGFGILLGLLAGVATVLVIDHLDDSIRNPDELRKLLDTPVLGIVPRNTGGDRTAVALEPLTAVSETYQGLSATLRFVSEDGVPKVLLFTSARPGEGKTVSTVALAAQFALLGKSVLIIDCDLRNPNVHSVLDLPNTVGVSNFLSGEASLESLVQTAGRPGLSVLSSGPLPPDPAMLLASMRLPELVAAARDQYDLVIIDSSPVMWFADAPLLGAAADATVMVVEAGGAGRAALRDALRRLRATGTRVVGVVLTKFIDETRQRYYGYYGRA
jgi:succinoglycan biosynthesis transport protein ExoP